MGQRMGQQRALRGPEGHVPFGQRAKKGPQGARFCGHNGRALVLTQRPVDLLVHLDAFQAASVKFSSRHTMSVAERPFKSGIAGFVTAVCKYAIKSEKVWAIPRCTSTRSLLHREGARHQRTRRSRSLSSVRGPRPSSGDKRASYMAPIDRWQLAIYATCALVVATKRPAPVPGEATTITYPAA